MQINESQTWETWQIFELCFGSSVFWACNCSFVFYVLWALCALVPRIAVIWVSDRSWNPCSVAFRLNSFWNQWKKMCNLYTCLMYFYKRRSDEVERVWWSRVCGGRWELWWLGRAGRLYCCWNGEKYLCLSESRREGAVMSQIWRVH